MPESISQAFDFNSQQIRTVIHQGSPWFVAADVCAILEIGKYRDAIARLDDDERRLVVVDTLGGAQEMASINESGLYSLILTSRKPQAKQFKKWVTAEVLPAIRQTGRYETPTDPANENEWLRMDPRGRAAISAAYESLALGIGDMYRLLAVEQGSELDQHLQALMKETRERLRVDCNYGVSFALECYGMAMMARNIHEKKYTMPIYGLDDVANIAAQVKAIVPMAIE